MSGGSGGGGGVRVAVLGGGVAGAAAAGAILLHARAHARSLHVKLFRGRLERSSSLAPAILGPECRSRLASLGIDLRTTRRRVQDVRVVEVVSERRTEVLPLPAGGLWVVDAWTAGASGQELLSDAAAQAAFLNGAEISIARPDRVERPGAGQARPAGGRLLVRVDGRAERFDAAVLATGAGDPWRDRFFPGFRGAPTVPAAHARLRFRTLAPLGAPAIRLILSPQPGVDGLYLVPCGITVYALAFGPGAGTAELCQAVMAAARDGHLADGFEIAAAGATALPSGAGARLTAPGQVAVGPVALGHPLQIGLSQTLAGCTRAATALLEHLEDGPALDRRYVRDGLREMVREANEGARAVPWLVRSGRRAAGAFARAVRAGNILSSFSSGVLGLPGPSPGALLEAARWSGIVSALERLLRPALEPLPPSAPVVEPDLYYVVDDDGAARDALAQFLESQGAQVVTFSSELALFAAVARRPPTAILLDVVLQWVDGLRLCEGLKRHPLTRGCRVFVMSGLDLPHVRERALRAGAEAFFPKPIEPQLLLQILAAHRALRADPPGAGAALNHVG
jgi:CheY-like chemotaxis protein